MTIDEGLQDSGFALDEEVPGTPWFRFDIGRDEEEGILQHESEFWGTQIFDMHDNDNEDDDHENDDTSTSDCAHDNDHENDGPRACYNDSKGGTNHDNHNHNSRIK